MIPTYLMTLASAAHEDMCVQFMLPPPPARRPNGTRRRRKAPHMYSVISPSGRKVYYRGADLSTALRLHRRMREVGQRSILIGVGR